MTPSRRGDSGGSRSAAERERDRQERERRRARQNRAAGRDDPPPIFDASSLEAPPPLSGDEWVPPLEEEPRVPPATQPHRVAEPWAPADPNPAADAWDRGADAAAPADPWEPGADAAAWDRRAASPVDAGDRGGAAMASHEDPWPAEPRASRSARERSSGSGVAGAARAARTVLSGALDAARTRAAERLGRPEAEPRAAAGAGSLRRSRRPGAERRPVVRPGARGRSTVSKTKRNLRAPGAPASRRGRVAAVVALGAVVVVLWFLFSLFQPFKGSGHGTVSVDIPSGASSGQIATLLADRGVISSAFFFKLRATLAGKRGDLESGHFDLHKDMSYGAVLDALTGHMAQPAVIKVTIPEGLSRTEIAKLATTDGVSGDYVKASVHSHLLKPKAYGAKKAHSLEGFLFPSTYDLLPGEPASKLVNDQLATFQTNIATVDLHAAHKKNLTTYDVLTIASMVEREAQVPAERKLISAVIYNRLHSGMPLGIDATIRYAINDYQRPLTAADLRLNSPYNTRRHKGLPPTPIGNPGLASIDAAAHPAAVSYQYYVVKPGTCGEHAFSSTFAQFQVDAARYANARAAAGGRSPTTCH